MEEFPQDNLEKEPPIQKHKKWVEKMKLLGEVVLGVTVSIVAVEYISREILKMPPIDDNTRIALSASMGSVWSMTLLQGLKKINQKYKNT